jgi:hypothetical protein
MAQLWILATSSGFAWLIYAMAQAAGAGHF